jgi:hypothetical protein
MQANFDSFPNLILENDAVLRPLLSTDVVLDGVINEPDTWQFSLIQTQRKENLENTFN